VVAHFVGAVLGVAIAHQILGVRLSSAPVLYLVTIPGTYGKLTAFIAEFALSGLLMGIVLDASNHRPLVRFSPTAIPSVSRIENTYCGADQERGFEEDLIVIVVVVMSSCVE